MIDFNMKSTILFLAILTTALSAGLFYAWAVSVIPGLKNIPSKSYIEAMQSINRAILNPGFFIIFFGSLVLLLLSAYYQYNTKIDMSFWFIIAATLFYLVGTIGITVFGNVPMNENMDLVNIMALNGDQIESTRLAYESKWNQLHTIRTYFSVTALVMLLLSIFTGGTEA